MKVAVKNFCGFMLFLIESRKESRDRDICHEQQVTFVRLAIDRVKL